MLLRTGLDELFKTRCEYIPVRLPSAIPADDSLEKLIQACPQFGWIPKDNGL